MRRQRTRKTIAFLSFLLFPVTIYFFSPYLIVMGAARGVVAGSALMFAALFVSGLFLGRAGCGWFCPVGGLQNCCEHLTDKRLPAARPSKIKYAIWALWLLSIAALLAANGVRQVDPLFMNDRSLPLLEASGYIIYFGVLALVLIPTFAVGKRAFCRYICWISPFMALGGAVGRRLRIPQLHIEADADTCIRCGRCAKKCPMAIPIDQQAASGDVHHSECTLCGECIDACPKAALRFRHAERTRNMKDFKALSERQFDKQARSVWGRDGYNSHLYRPILNALESLHPRRVLDLGCGGGAFLALAARALPDAEWTGLDLSANMVALARGRLGSHADIAQGDAEAMPFADGAFDAVTCNESFHHYPHPEAALSEVFRVLRPGGALLLCDMAMSERMRRLANWLFKRLNTGDVRAYSEAEVLALLDTAGFRDAQYANLSPSAFLCVAKKSG